MTIRPWKIRSSHYVFDERWLKIRSDRCENADGVIIEPYYVNEPCDWVHVVAFDKQERILITRQYRHGSQLIELEVPCGGVDVNEDPLAAMKRELLEETGCIAERFEALPVTSANPSSHANKVFPFMALGVEQIAEQNLDKTEEIEFEFIAIADLMSLIDKGIFRQPIHIASIFMALRKRNMLSLSI